MFQRILVPVDLTQKSLAAVDLAYDFAVLSKAEVTLLHIIETVEYVQFDEMKGFYKRLEESARTGLELFGLKERNASKAKTQLSRQWRE